MVTIGGGRAVHQARHIDGLFQQVAGTALRPAVQHDEIGVIEQGELPQVLGEVFQIGGGERLQRDSARRAIIGVQIAVRSIDVAATKHPLADPRAAVVARHSHELKQLRRGIGFNEIGIDRQAEGLGLRPGHRLRHIIAAQLKTCTNNGSEIGVPHMGGADKAGDAERRRVAEKVSRCARRAGVSLFGRLQLRGTQARRRSRLRVAAACAASGVPAATGAQYDKGDNQRRDDPYAGRTTQWRMS